MQQVEFKEGDEVYFCAGKYIYARRNKVFKGYISKFNKQKDLVSVVATFSDVGTWHCTVKVEDLCTSFEEAALILSLKGIQAKLSISSSDVY